MATFFFVLIIILVCCIGLAALGLLFMGFIFFGPDGLIFEGSVRLAVFSHIVGAIVLAATISLAIHSGLNLGDDCGEGTHYVQTGTTYVMSGKVLVPIPNGECESDK